MNNKSADKSYVGDSIASKSEHEETPPETRDPDPEHDTRKKPGEQEQLVGAFGHITVGENEILYVGSAHWAAILSEVSLMRKTRCRILVLAYIMLMMLALERYKKLRTV